MLKSTQNKGKGLHKVFNTAVKNIILDLPPLGEFGSELSHFVPEPRNFAKVTRVSDDINKPWLKVTLKKIKSLINNQTFLVEDPEKDDPVFLCMDVYKAKIQPDGSIDNLKLIIVVI